MNSLKLKTRITLLVLSAVFGIVILTALSALSIQRDLQQGRQELIRSIIEANHSILSYYHAQERQGTLSREDAQQRAVDTLLAGRYGGHDGRSEYTYAFTMDGVGVAHLNSDLIGQEVIDAIQDGQGRYTIRNMVSALKTQPNGAFVETSVPRPGETETVPKLQYVKQFTPWNWFIGTGIYMDDLATEVRSSVLREVVTSIVILLTIAAIGIWLARGVLRQVGGEPGEAIELMNRAANGDLQVNVRNAPKGSMLASLGTMVKSLQTIVAEIRTESQQLNSSANGINSAAADVAKASNEQAEATASMAAAVEEMTVSISHISDSAKQTEQDSLASADLAGQGVAKVSEANSQISRLAEVITDASSRVKALNQRAEQISTIASSIKEIADQTNLLALNAAIEAARAGDQGRGFAVVASEVRTLAGRTQTATTEIDEMIAGIQADTKEVVVTIDAALPQVESGSQSTREAAELLEQLRQGADSALERVREVANATREQSLASTAIAEKVEQVSMMVDETSQAMQATSENAEDLNRISRELNELVSRFKV